ncbi:hypothetical protein [Sphingomonas soli]|uniref:hypothetical protein n=1 Tax=Sphingomonas soli TaxID=266127 RepID=UPI0008354FF1|nr:hypothetical protein [Sphingomonas soli]
MPVTKLENGARLIEPAGQADQRDIAHGGNFSVEWLAHPGHAHGVNSADEIIALFADSGGEVSGAYGSVAVPEMTVAILPPGVHAISAGAARGGLIIATRRRDIAPGEGLNAGAPRDERIALPGEPFARITPLDAPLLLPVESIPTPPGNPRIRFLQTATMSINIVLYDGPRGKKALSPHAHDDIEQGSLAIHGDYVHHLRTPWGLDASAWVDDAHLEAGPHSLLLIPPHLIHTTEGVGPGRHLLLDIFAPPRGDFIAKGWMANAADYLAPTA